MTPGEMCAAIEAILESHRPTTTSMLGGTGYFVDNHLVVAVIGGRLCQPTGDPGLPAEGERFVFAGCPVPGWASLDPSRLDPAALAALIGLRLSLL